MSAINAPLILEVLLSPNPVNAGANLKISVLVEECTHARLEKYTHEELTVFTHTQLATEQLD
jgi:hypothetical protein